MPWVGSPRARRLPLDVCFTGIILVFPCEILKTCPEPALVTAKHGENMLQSNWERNLRSVLLKWLPVTSDQGHDPHGTAATCPCSHTDHTQHYKNTDFFFNMLIGTFLFDSLFGILAIPYG